MRPTTDAAAFCSRKCPSGIGTSFSSCKATPGLICTTVFTLSLAVTVRLHGIQNSWVHTRNPPFSQEVRWRMANQQVVGSSRRWIDTLTTCRMQTEFLLCPFIAEGREQASHQCMGRLHSTKEGPSVNVKAAGYTAQRKRADSMVKGCTTQGNTDLVCKQSMLNSAMRPEGSPKIGRRLRQTHCLALPPAEQVHQLSKKLTASTI